MPEPERAQERAQRRRRPHPVEDLDHSAVPQHVQIVDGVRAGEHPRDHARRLGCGVGRGHAQPLLEQVVQPGPFGQPHHRHETRRPDQVRVIENRGHLVECLHLSDAPSEPVESNCRKSNSPAPQGHPRATTPPDTLTDRWIQVEITAASSVERIVRGDRMGEIHWRPRRQDSWGILAISFCLIVAGAVLGATTPTKGVLIVGGILIGAAALLRDRWLQRSQLDDSRRSSLALALAAVQSDGSLPTLKQLARAQLRVHKSIADIPYQQRDAHALAKASVTAAKPVLIIGESLAGKTRMAYEVVREVAIDWPVLIPGRPNGLMVLHNEQHLPSKCIVWLDDIEDFLAAPEGISTTWIDDCLRRACLVVATIRTSEYEKFQPDGEIRSPAWDLLERFTLVPLVDSRDERARLANGVPPEIMDPILMYGVGPYLGGGAMAHDRLVAAKARHPLGVALLATGTAWRVLGLGDVPARQLRQLAPMLISDEPRHVPIEDFGTALAWATKAMPGGIQLLSEANGRYQVFDFVADFFAQQKISVNPDLWAAALSYADPSQRRVMAQAALHLRAYEFAAEAYESFASLSAEGAFNAGVLNERLHRYRKAQLLHEQALLLDDPEYSPMSAVNLGIIMRDQRDYDAAIPYFEYAVDSRHRDQEAKALLNLGTVHQLRRDLASAKTAYERAIALNHTDYSIKAHHNLGAMLSGDGSPVQAITHLRASRASSDPEISASSWFNMGIAYERATMPRRAIECFRTAFKAEGTGVWSAATIALALAQMADEPAAAAGLLERVMTADDVFQSRRAGLLLANLSFEQGDHAKMRAACEVVMSGDNDELTQAARWMLSQIE